MLAVWVLRNYSSRQGQQGQQGRQKGSSADKLAVLSSTVSSRMLAAIAEQEGAHWAETLTGFKASGPGSSHASPVTGDVTDCYH